MDNYFYDDEDRYIEEDLDDPDVVLIPEPGFPLHNYDKGCEACNGDRCQYAGMVQVAWCELHGEYDPIEEDGNCPTCLMVACDWQAGAYAGMEYVDGHYQ